MCGISCLFIVVLLMKLLMLWLKVLLRMFLFFLLVSRMM